jgi:hypothetical protein
MLSAAQIVELACQACKVPGYKAQAGQLLNMVLDNLAQIYDFDTERVEVDLPVSGDGAGYDLPENHLRTRQIQYSINGVPYKLVQFPFEQFKLLPTVSQPATYPRAFATNVAASPHQLLLYPRFIQSTTLTVIYQPTPSPIVAPESSNVIPWFPNQQILLKQLNAALSMLAEDDRMVSFDQIAETNLSKFLTMSDDKEGYAKQVKLDGRLFRSPDRLRPTKNIPV